MTSVDVPLQGLWLAAWSPEPFSNFAKFVAQFWNPSTTAVPLRGQNERIVSRSWFSSVCRGRTWPQANHWTSCWRRCKWITWARFDSLKKIFYLREWSRIPAMMFLLHMSKISLVRSLTSFSKACASLVKACDSSLSLRKVWIPFNIFITCPASVNEWLVCKWRTNEMCYLSFKLSRCINLL